MNVLDLFSGIGGFSLGLERAGMRTVAFCEIDPYCQRVLRKHWPTVPIFGDIRELTGKIIADTIGGQLRKQSGRRNGTGRSDPAQSGCDGPQGIDLICGGFPCQDISVAGKGAGIDGERSGLWSEYARIIGELRPRYVIVENVAALLNRGLERVLGDLAALGYDAEWHCIPASAVGAPHRRDRVWIVAWPVVADAAGSSADRYTSRTQPQYAMLGNGGETLADAPGDGMEGHRAAWQQEPGAPIGAWLSGCNGAGSGTDHWLVEPDVGRVAHGVPSRVDRLKSLGNAVVPQIPEIIGRAIMSASPLPSKERGT